MLDDESSMSIDTRLRNRYVPHTWILNGSRERRAYGVMMRQNGSETTADPIPCMDGPTVLHVADICRA
ncbi:MAG: hypothetical protein CMJ59_01070 [Planctomycetaceae bacterium]|nr:hypothetical protein [Planctomycetaceae bacterium]